jgi:hypothetical protein
MMRAATISSQKNLGRKTVVVLPVHYPRELFTAMDVHTVELWGPPGSSSRSRCRPCAIFTPRAGTVPPPGRSCKPYSIGQIDLKGRLASEEGVKGLLLEADHADPRSWSEAQAYNRLHAFMELFD